MYWIIRSLFRTDLLERKRRFPSWVGAENKFAADLNFGEKAAFLLRLVQDSARLKWAGLTSSYEGSNSRLCNIKPKKKRTVKRQADTETQWNISRVSFLFISLKEKLDLTLFCVRRSQYLFLIQSLLFLTVACNATPTRLAESSRVTCGKQITLHPLLVTWV